MSSLDRVFPDVEFSGSDVESICDAERFSVVLRKNEGRRLGIYFDDVRSYRVTDEGDRQVFVSKLLTVEPDFHWLYKTKESEYLTWLSNESYDTFLASPYAIYIIVTRNDIIEIVSHSDPSVVESPPPPAMGSKYRTVSPP